MKSLDKDSVPIYLQSAVYCTKNSPCCRNFDSHIYKADAINFTDSSPKIHLEQYSYDHMRIVAHGDCAVLPQHPTHRWNHAGIAIIHNAPVDVCHCPQCTVLSFPLVCYSSSDEPQSDDDAENDLN